MRRGINLGGVLDRRDGRRGWELRPHHLNAVVTAGFDTIRVPVRWWGHAGAGGPLAFELLNEPRAPMTPGDWDALLPAVLRTLREIDPGRPVLVGGAEASTVAGLRRLDLPPDDHLIATVH
jgi:aryl-phospho-beta-D-glucosidase BglC (GH1 family)